MFIKNFYFPYNSVPLIVKRNEKNIKECCYNMEDEQSKVRYDKRSMLLVAKTWYVSCLR